MEEELSKGQLQEVQKIFEDALDKQSLHLKEFMELTELKAGAEKDWGKKSRIDKFNTKVLKAIKKLDSGKQGSLGPTLKEIAEEAGVERHVAAETLARMKDSGVLYEPRPGHYRLV